MAASAAAVWRSRPPLTTGELRLTIVYLAGDSPADIDNIIKPIQDALAGGDRGDAEAAYLIAWSALEGLLRRRAVQAAIPIERLQIAPLARHLYTQGELSAEELDEVLATLATRNRLVHDFESSTVGAEAERLGALLDRLPDDPSKATASVA